MVMLLEEWMREGDTIKSLRIIIEKGKKRLKEGQGKYTEKTLVSEKAI